MKFLGRKTTSICSIGLILKKDVIMQFWKLILKRKKSYTMICSFILRLINRISSVIDLTSFQSLDIWPVVHEYNNVNIVAGTMKPWDGGTMWHPRRTWSWSRPSRACWTTREWRSWPLKTATSWGWRNLSSPRVRYTQLGIAQFLLGSLTV